VAKLSAWCHLCHLAGLVRSGFSGSAVCHRVYAVDLIGDAGRSVRNGAALVQTPEGVDNLALIHPTGCLPV
jgi:hypothetical protein